MNGTTTSPPPGGDGGTRTTRVIEKLMAENDRLRRELKVETTARDEERKAKEALRAARDSMASTNANLVLQNNIDKSSLQRKDRKIDELRTQFEFEKETRLEAEQSLRVQIRETDETVHELRAQVSREVMERKRAVNEYDVLKSAFERMDAGYRGSVERLRGQLVALKKEREKDGEVLKRLEVTIEQQAQELEKMRSAKRGIEERCDRTLQEAEAEIARIREMADEREKVLDGHVEGAKDTLGTLKHLIGVKKNLREEV